VSRGAHSSSSGTPTIEWAVFPEVQIGPITVRDAKFIVDDQSLDIPRDFDAIIGLDLLAKTSGFLIDYAAKKTRPDTSEVLEARLRLDLRPIEDEAGCVRIERRLGGKRPWSCPNVEIRQHLSVRDFNRL
jgi:hypothetical protein